MATRAEPQNDFSIIGQIAGRSSDTIQRIFVAKVTNRQSRATRLIERDQKIQPPI